MIRKLRRRLTPSNILVAFIVVGLSLCVYLTLFHLADSIITSLRSHPDKQREVKATRGRRMETSVVVAHYIGTGNLFANISDDVINQNFYDPHPNEGALGRPVAISPREVLKMHSLFKINRYNLLASDRIPLNRTLSDVRNKRCMDMDYGSNLPTTSVIIVFHNEAWSVLLRTVWSVINRSPKYLVVEILLVDDASQRTFLKKDLDDYVKNLPVRTKVLRLPSRQGLVAARLLGAKHASGETLTFLDAHCECSIGWLEPLLARVQLDRRKVACPVIDIVSEDTFAYLKSFDLHWGAFNWQLHFRWYLMGEKSLRKQQTNVITPFTSPAMAGGLFTIHRDFFYEMGSYDEQMHIWGGDNLEMSFRMWQCGGEIEIVPCSHVGHLFRKSSPYTFPGGVGEVLNQNLARTALVWMDEWAEFFIRYQNVDRSMVDTLNVTSRKLLRQSLQCRSFEWYLSNVWPDHFFPAADRLLVKLVQLDIRSQLYSDYLAIFSDFDPKENFKFPKLITYLNERTEQLTSLFTDRMSSAMCLQKPLAVGGSVLAPYGQASVQRCSEARISMNDMFILKPNSHIITNEGICVDSLYNETATAASIVRIVACQNTSRQKWRWNFRTQQLQLEHNAEACVTAGEATTDDGTRLETELKATSSEAKFNATLIRCSSRLPQSQRWLILPMQWKWLGD